MKGERFAALGKAFQLSTGSPAGDGGHRDSSRGRGGGPHPPPTARQRHRAEHHLSPLMEVLVTVFHTH